MTDQNNDHDPVQEDMALAPIAHSQVPAAAPLFTKLTPAMNLDEAKEQITMVQDFVQSVMVEGEDYFTELGGTKLGKPSLGKSGSEKLVNFFALSPVYEEMPEPGWVRQLRASGQPVVYHYYRCKLYHTPTGAMVAEGLGACHTEEAQYKYRWLKEAELTNAQEKEATKNDYPRKMNNWSKKIVRFPNPEIYAEDNKVVKIGKKRSFVDAVLTATRASHKFTQDMEDGGGGGGAPSGGGDSGGGEEASWSSDIPAYLLAFAFGAHTDLDVSDERLQEIMIEVGYVIEERISKKKNKVMWVKDVPGPVAKAAQQDREKRTDEDIQCLKDFADGLIGKKDEMETKTDPETPPDDPKISDPVEKEEQPAPLDSQSDLPFDEEPPPDDAPHPADRQEPSEKVEAEVVEEEEPKAKPAADPEEKPSREGRPASAKQLDWIIHGSDPKKTTLFARVLKRMSLKPKNDQHRVNVFRVFCTQPTVLDRVVKIGPKVKDECDITMDEAQVLIDLFKLTDAAAARVEKLVEEAFEETPE